MLNFGQTSNSRVSPIPRNDGRAKGDFRELFGENWPRDIGSAMHNHFGSFSAHRINETIVERCCFIDTGTGSTAFDVIYVNMRYL